jgi:hypothetical protein
MRKNVMNISMSGSGGSVGATGAAGGNVMIGPIGINSNVNGQTLVSGVLALQEANENFGGVLTAGPSQQDIGGPKLFHDDVSTLTTFRLPSTTDSTHGVLYIDTQPFLHSYGGASNTFLGENSCIDNSPAPSSENTGLGNNCLASIITPAQGNTSVGSACLPLLTTGIGNSALGWSTLSNCISGSSNSALGASVLSNCTGSGNIGIGYLSGQSVTSGNDTINIGCIGTTGSSEINIGTTGTHAKTCIAGIGGVSPGGTPQSVIINPTTGQLGSQTITTSVTTLAAVGSSPNANGATISSSTLNFQPCNGTNPGVITSGTQTIGGNKTFTGTIGASNLSGTNTGDITLAAVGASPNANGLTLTGSALNLQPCDGTNPGVITAGTQTIGGNKTLTGTIAASNLSGTNTGDVTIAAPFSVTPTLNSGTITTMTVRGSGATQIPNVVFRMGNTVFLTLPQFAISAITGSPTAITIGSGSLLALYRPTFDQMLPVVMYVGTTTYANAFIGVTSAGVVTLQLVSQAVFTVTFGLFKDLTVSWNVV